jgi:D-serine deaminase-like pyridoxal phosphate-dependent protein
MIEQDPYRIADPDGLETPAMVVFEEMVDHNIAALCELVGGAANLMVHVKTHKSEAIARKQLDAGISGFKCATLRELEMGLEAGAPEVILAYPMVQHRKVERFADISAEHTGRKVYATVGDQRHVDMLVQMADARQQTLRVMVDLDVGMHRTGAGVGDEAADLYAAIHAAQRLETSGLHVYDGHEHFRDPEARAAAAQRHVDDLKTFKGQLESRGMSVPRIVGGGSFSYATYARAEGFHGSPGTVIYWDINGTTRMSDQPYRWAAMVLCQVVDRHPDQLTVTTDLGVKAIAADPPLDSRARLLGHEQAKLLLQNEEHGVFLWTDAESLPQVGDYLLAIPGHVCPTTIRFPGSYVIDAQGSVVDYYPHTARDRQ